MRRWSVARKTGVAIAVVVAIGALYQLPASPFAHPDRPASTAPQDLSAGQASTAGQGVVPQRKPVDQGERSSSLPVRPQPSITYSVRGTASYAVLPGDPTVIGRRGRLLTFQIAVEGGINGIDRVALAQFVRATYGAPQGWASGRLWRFQQVGPGHAADFTLMLVTPATRGTLCGGRDRYTSCRIGNRVVLNIARWVHGVPNYGAPLVAYRQYMVNHETGHRLGFGHELCPGPGQPAPIMQQQTLGLHGCTPYAWPYVNGLRYKGRLGQYDDPVPQS
jgi:hypothetical protein